MNTESVGAKLKKIRLEKGLSLEEVQKKTKIHLNILKSMEGDSLTDLNPVYLKGFLKIYCKFLGLDPKDYIPDFKETQRQVSDVIPVKYVSDKSRGFIEFLKTATIKLGSIKATTKKFKRIFVPILIIIILMLGLFNLGKFVASKRKAHLTQKKPSSSIKYKRENKKEQKSQQAGIITPTPKPALMEAKSQKETASGIRLIIKAKENCWVHLKADGRVVFQRVLEKGRSESWQAKDRIELSLGNAGAVELQVNDQLFSNLGRRGQVRKNILITKEGLNIGR